jgi:hypothetical protein
MRARHRRSTLAALVIVVSHGVALVAGVAGSARADVTMSKEGVAHETPVAQAAVRLGAALQDSDRATLDRAAHDLTTTTEAFGGWLAGHDAERTPAIARIVTTAWKLGQAADRLRTLLDQHAAAPLLQQAAIDGLHRYNEFIGAHQGEPPPAEIAMPAALRERFLVMMERIGRDAQAHRGDCAKLAAALMAHVDDDAATAKALHDIDDARPQDQRAAERIKPDPRGQARLRAALARHAPLAACGDDATLATYKARVGP